MHAQDNLWSGFDGPAKTATSAFTLLTAWVGYIKANVEKRRNAKAASAYIGDGAWLFRLLTEISPLLYLLSGCVVFVVAALQLLRQGVETAAPGFGYVQRLSPFSMVLDFADQYYWYIIGVAVVFYLSYLFGLLELAICGIAGFIPRLKNTIAWANASWFIRDHSKTVPVIGVQRTQIKRIANDLVNNLVDNPRSSYLALRPNGLSTVVAGNVLLFGHIIEAYHASINRKSFQWTLLYDALAKSVDKPNSPFLPHEILRSDDSSSLFHEILNCNTLLPASEKIANDTGLEEAVRDAFGVLRSRWRGDASKLNEGFSGDDYRRVVANSATILRASEMQRQFAKLYILWNITANASRPDLFEIPFSRGMLVRFIDEGVLNVTTERLATDDQRTQIVFSYIDRKIIGATRSLIETTRDMKRSQWRELELKETSARGIDWVWWISYRIDTQLYADSRGYNSKSWKILDNQIEKIKG